MPVKASRVACAVLLASAVLAAREARADDDDGPKSFTLGTVGFAIGAAEIADIQGTAIGLHLDAGRTFGDFHLQLEYGVGGFTETKADYTQGRGAILQRFGGLVRWHALNKGFGDSKFRLQVWLEAGYGKEFWQWNEGGKLSRDMGQIGFGFGFLGNLAGYHKKPHWLGTYYDFRFTLADSPYESKNTELVCAGPCDEPTPPVPIDFGFLFVLGVNFGR